MDGQMNGQTDGWMDKIGKTYTTRRSFAGAGWEKSSRESEFSVKVYNNNNKICEWF